MRHERGGTRSTLNDLFPSMLYLEQLVQESHKFSFSGCAVLCLYVMHVRVCSIG